MQTFRQMMELFNLNTLSYSYVLLQGIANSELLILHPRTHGFGREMVSVGEGGIRVGQIKASGKCVPGARIMD